MGFPDAWWELPDFPVARLTDGREGSHQGEGYLYLSDHVKLVGLYSSEAPRVSLRGG